MIARAALLLAFLPIFLEAAASGADPPVFGVRTVDMPAGERALAVNYPWTTHPRTSVEVRLVTGRTEEPFTARPVFFVEKYFKALLMVEIHRCLGEAAGVGVTKELSKDDFKFDVFGRRNGLGKPSVCIARHILKSESAPGAAAAFVLLSRWAKTPRLLYLDLPREHFAEPGELHVWFLRGGKVVWSHQMDWPGY